MQCQIECAPNFPAGKAQQTRIINDACRDFSWDPICLSYYFMLANTLSYISLQVLIVNLYIEYLTNAKNARDFEFIHSFAPSLYIMARKKKGVRRIGTIYRSTAKGFISLR